MLQHFTWHQFLLAALILSLIWYTGVILLFYRSSLKDLLTDRAKRPISPEPLKHSWEEDFEEQESAIDEDEFMGKAAVPEGLSTLSMADFGFAPKVDPVSNEQVTGQRAHFDQRDEDAWLTQLGLIPDLLEELKSIFYILQKEQGTKDDFISLFALISSKYSHIRNSSNQQALNDYIRENLSFEISDQELNKLWR